MSRNRALLFSIVSVSLLGALPQISAELVSLELYERSSFADGALFDDSGAYQILRGVAHYEVDSTHPRNRVVVDIENAPRNVRGRIEFESDVFILAPADPTKGNGALLYGVNNRGRKNTLNFFNTARATNDPRTRNHAGDGFLFRHGYTIVWCGWITELLVGDNKLLLKAPVATIDNKPIRGRVRQEVVADKPVHSMPLSRRSSHGSYPPTDDGLKRAELTWRLRETDPRVPIPRSQWRLEQRPIGAVERGVSGSLPEIRLHLVGGFQPGSIYELIYETEGPLLQGLGFVATRDLISFLKYDNTERHPLLVGSASPYQYAYGFGVSQSGRYLRNFLHLRFNQDESGRKVFDGVIPHVAGAGLGFFNFRFAQPNRHNGQHEDHLFSADRFPFTYGKSVNPFDGQSDSILDLGLPQEAQAKVMHTQSAAEYWHRAGSLVHTDPLGQRDEHIPANVRIYTFGGTQHGPAAWPPTRGGAQNLRNPGDYKPLLRALLVALDAWVRDGTPPPPSVYPRIDSGTLVAWDQVSTAFPTLPGIRYPTVIQQPHQLNHGPQFAEGIITILPPNKRGDFVVLVPRYDADGNPLGTLLPPEVAVPLATYTGWNLRHRTQGAEDMLASLAGSFFPFPKTAADRRQHGDIRLSIEERYADFAEYRDSVRKECARLVDLRLLLQEDADRFTDELGKFQVLLPSSW